MPLVTECHCWFTCDGCGRETQAMGRTQVVAIDLVRKLGWRITRRPDSKTPFRVKCPECD